MQLGAVAVLELENHAAEAVLDVALAALTRAVLDRQAEVAQVGGAVGEHGVVEV